MQNFCRNCGEKLIVGNLFCTKCGMRIEGMSAPGQQVQQPAPQQGVQQQPVQPHMARTAATGIISNVTSNGMELKALSTPGQMGAGVVTQAVGAAGALGRNKLLPSLLVSAVLILLWLVQIVLMKMNVNPIPVKILNILTFARGGVSKNPIVFLGGNIGKGVVAAGLSGLVAGGFGTISAGAKRLVSQANFSKENVGRFVLGIGVGLLCYQICTGYGSLTGIMVAVSGALVAIRRTVDSGRFASVFSGATLGFAMAVPLAVIPFTFTHLIFGLFISFVGGILILVNKGAQPANVTY